ncbi:GW domain-containing glycosaminoglycan-binding protein [Listeria rocourtiae]|uniref:glucosaminidase domain-containing protein n=1 Tax=Listeria rocourtiae TaxID=647910 RepID=UPI001625E252|nr:glucosaminidase domain-containing protein [Listeria rocourtiae]MBC1606122.1 GW domain-containing glycosaminoglycan-binding protein [Listeria rocourtiae]
MRRRKKKPLLIGILLAGVVLSVLTFFVVAKLFLMEDEPVEVTRVDPKQEFIELLAGHAQQIQEKEGILTSITLAQAILESDWGNSGLATEGRNLFGIKGKYQNDSVMMPTKEYENDKWVTVDAAFRKYPTWYESLDDHANLFLKGTSWDKDKYREVVEAKDHRTAANALQKSGYATDPDYANKLIELIEQRNLQAYDKIYDTIISKKAMHETGSPKLTKNTTIWSSPPKTKGAKKINDIAKYGNEKMNIIQEMNTESGKWYQIKEGSKTLGWVNKDVIRIRTP